MQSFHSYRYLIGGGHGRFDRPGLNAPGTPRPTRQSGTAWRGRPGETLFRPQRFVLPGKLPFCQVRLPDRARARQKTFEVFSAAAFNTVMEVIFNRDVYSPWIAV